MASTERRAKVNRQTKSGKISSTVSPSPILNLPEDVIFQIFSRLPVKSLLQLRSICKLWLSQISSPNFIKTHLNRTVNHKTPSSLIVHRWNTNSGGEVISVIHLDSIENPIDLNPPTLPKLPTARIRALAVGCCNGIVCLTDTPEHGLTYLWNPATKQAKKIPLSDNIKKEFSSSDNVKEEEFIDCRMGFGFDPNSNDYKVVRIASHVEVYSENTDSWREIEAVEVSIIKSPTLVTCDVSVKGVLYWQTLAGQHLVSFDLHNEVFEQIPMPSNVYSGQTREQIVNFRESAAVIVYSRCRREVSLWTIDDGKKSWTKNFKFGAVPWVSFLFGYFKSGEIVVNEKARLFIYDSKIKRREYVRILDGVLNAFDYTQSLVSFKGSVQVQAEEDAC